MPILKRDGHGRAMPFYESAMARVTAKNDRRRERRRWEGTLRRVWVDYMTIGEGDECWTWAGALHRGYPQASQDGKHITPHRVIAAMFGDVIGKQVHHICRNRACLNPNHLEIVESWEHGYEHRASRCIRGHDLTDPRNVTVLSRGERRCRRCHAIRERSRHTHNSQA